jgi:hypothetical protein
MSQNMINRKIAMAQVKARQNMRRHIGNRTAPSRSAVLVINDAQFAPFLRKAFNRQQEILAAHAVHPAGAKNQVRNTGIHTACSPASLLWP